MDREFLNFYNRELSILREQGKEFAQEYPGIAERLGGLIDERGDPLIIGLLEGAAFLAARVQLKLKHEFAEFTVNMLDQLAPQYLAPTPSVVMIRAQPAFGDPALREGREIAQGSFVDATYREAQRNLACRFTLVEPIALWPLEVVEAEYAVGSKQLQSLMPNSGVDCAASLRLRLNLRAAKRPEEEPDDREADAKPELRISSCRLKSLRFFLQGAESQAEAMYEQLFGHCRGVYFRVLDNFGNPEVTIGDRAKLKPVGFDDDRPLIPNDRRLFRGLDYLRDYFTFSRRFLGFELDGLERVAPRLEAKKVDILFAFDAANVDLAAAARKEMFALHAAPAINLFRKRLDRIQLRSNQHEYPVIADRSRLLEFETHRVLSVLAHIPGETQPAPVAPLYSADAGRGGDGLCFTARRLPRRTTLEERRRGRQPDYLGSDLFLSLGERSESTRANRVAELSVEALCSNRHLPEHLPIGQSGADFRLLDDSSLQLECIAGPTRPREAPMTAMVGRGSEATAGDVAWRLVSMLSLNHLGLLERAAGEGGKALRETLMLFADPKDAATQKTLMGVRSVQATPAPPRRMRDPGGAAAMARGLEITVTLEDKAFEGSGPFLMGALLDRYFAEYVALNHFTQTVVRTVDRGEIMRWPPRIGLRGVL